MSKDSSDNKLAVKDKSWNPWVGVLVGLLALFGSQIVVGALAYLVLSLVKGYSVQHTSNLLENSISAQFVTLVLAEIVAVTIVILYIRGYKDSFKTIGLRKPKWLDPIFGLIAFPAYLIIYIVLLTILTHVFHGINVNEKQQLGFNDPKGALKLIMTFISLVIAPPIAEEIIFRGLIYSSLKKTLPIWAAVIITGLLFAAGHLSEGGSSGLLYVAAIDTFSLSLVLVFLREKTGGLWSSMTLHALKNTVAFLALFALHLG
jgi:membrane protease YdiL (CAAX protease family)